MWQYSDRWGRWQKYFVEKIRKVLKFMVNLKKIRFFGKIEVLALKKIANQIIHPWVKTATDTVLVHRPPRTQTGAN